MARHVVAWGAEVLVVPIDLEDSPSGLEDLEAVAAMAKEMQVPVLARDWFLHPLQVIEAKEKGAAGVIGVIAQVMGRGAAVVSMYSAALVGRRGLCRAGGVAVRDPRLLVQGMDCPVEIVNAQEIEDMSNMRVPFFGLNLNIGTVIAGRSLCPSCSPMPTARTSSWT